MKSIFHLVAIVYCFCIISQRVQAADVVLNVSSPVAVTWSVETNNLANKNLTSEIVRLRKQVDSGQVGSIERKNSQSILNAVESLSKGNTTYSIYQITPGVTQTRIRVLVSNEKINLASMDVVDPKKVSESIFHITKGGLAYVERPGLREVAVAQFDFDTLSSLALVSIINKTPLTPLVPVEKWIADKPIAVNSDWNILVSCDKALCPTKVSLITTRGLIHKSVDFGSQNNAGPEDRPADTKFFLTAFGAENAVVQVERWTLVSKTTTFEVLPNAYKLPKDFILRDRTSGQEKVIDLKN